jgi:dTDP-4-dehydrorhamnose 3,5-epimerase
VTSGSPPVPQAPRDRPVEPAIDGVEIRWLRPIVDHRGSLTELLDVRDDFWREPIVYAYAVMIGPGRIKGWGMHELQTDRYHVAAGSLRVVLHDGRAQSPTSGRFQILNFSDAARGLVRIPPGVWHADQNWGADDALIVNYPTRPFDRENPDKFRIDPHSGEIPFDWSLPDR